MLYYSTKGSAPAVTLKEAVLKGPAPDGGLYMPEKLPRLDRSFIRSLHGRSLEEISLGVASAFLGSDIPSDVLEGIVAEALDFPIPLAEVQPGVFSLELYHGPTMAFKDVGARFMSRLMSFLYRNREKPLNVIVATSGDTGSAVASGFYEVDGINVVVLFPKGRVSRLQRLQITTLGGNIHPLEVEGNFDDCQRLARIILADEELNGELTLTSANSINVGRLIPQCFYYFHAYALLGDEAGEPSFSVPSGNFGNLTAGVMARCAGLPVRKFIASVNINDVFPEFLASGQYRPAASVPTYSSAMDVGDPSNFARLDLLMGGLPVNFRESIMSWSFTDEQTADAIRRVSNDTGYIMDPHGAVAWLGLERYAGETGYEGPRVFLETAHPAKFPETMGEILGKYEYVPPQFRMLDTAREAYTQVPCDAGAVKDYLLDISR